MTSRCKFCQYYRFEGRRGGTCQLLNVPVAPTDLGCRRGVPLFSTTSDRTAQNRVALFVPPAVVLGSIDRAEPSSEVEQVVG